MSSLNDCFNAVLQACESPLVSYNMGNQYYNHPPYDYKPDRDTIYTYYDFNNNVWTQDCCCDCSSLMGWGLYRGGYVQNYFACDTLSMMGGYMAQCGWVNMGNPNSVIWQAGDILVGTTHTEMVYQGNGSTTGITMGAHGRTGDYAPELTSNAAEKLRRLQAQVSVQTGLSAYHGFTQLWRDPNGGTVTPTINVEWKQINNVSTQYYYVDNGNLGNDVTNAGFPNPDQLNNMILITSYFKNVVGASNASIAGIIGNMLWESTLNPNCWQNGYVSSTGGYGLVQFDPPTKYIGTSFQPSDYATNAEANGTAQLEFLVYSMRNPIPVHGTQWIPTASYPYTVDQFFELTDPQEACSAFLWEYERAGAPQESIRRNNAQWVYDNMSNWGNLGWSTPHTRPNEKQSILLLQRRRKGYFI